MCGAWLPQEDVPARFHYNHNRRVTPVVGLAAKGWAIEECVAAAVRTSVALRRGDVGVGCAYTRLGVASCRSRASTAWFGKGMHGYDNEEADMHAIFLAR